MVAIFLVKRLAMATMNIAAMLIERGSMRNRAPSPLAPEARLCPDAGEGRGGGWRLK